MNNALTSANAESPSANPPAHVMNGFGLSRNRTPANARASAEVPLDIFERDGGPARRTRSATNAHNHLLQSRNAEQASAVEEEPKPKTVEGTADARKAALSHHSGSNTDVDVYECPMCFEPVRLREPMATKCGHVFCSVCIVAALHQSHKCPLCNKEMTKSQLFRIYL
ncbi:TNF receptor-associated factor 6-like [Scaptodrosophila lebanonensis]|uniref:TNF receptor-associated factor 6-like n=1 Tax=Drosophila lebanonensis TaxID=7225 RepID=A0A6J2TYW7_DROLE|nr:TNF receptor-associated factor 6-like [Scaptodrosophila lebanonensis]